MLLLEETRKIKGPSSTSLFSLKSQSKLGASGGLTDAPRKVPSSGNNSRNPESTAVTTIPANII